MRTGLPPSQYRDYMASEAWRRKRAWWRSVAPAWLRRCWAHGRRCRVATDLHHVRYVRLGCERWWDLVPLCGPAHDDLHDLQRRYGWSVQHASWVYLRGALARRAARFVLTNPLAWAIIGVSLLVLR